MVGEIFRILSSYNSFPLIGKLAALRLMPENADCHLRLDLLCHCVTSLTPDKAKGDISENELNDICNNLEKIGLEFLINYMYPSENLFTENVHFIGGGYNVFPGISLNSAFQLRLLINGLYKINLANEQKEFIDNIFLVVHTILSLSHEMLKKAGLNYGVFVQNEGNFEIKVPSKNELEKLVSAVTFTNSELSELELEIDILNEFCCELGSIKEDYEPDQTILNLKPLVKYQDNIIIVSPHLILSSLIHYIFCKAQEYNCLNKLAAAISDAAELSSEMSMQKMGSNLLADLNTDYFFLKAGIYNLDSDKVAVTLTVTDPLDDYDSNQMFTKANGNYVSTALKNTIVNTIEFLGQQPSPPKSILFIIAIQNFGREISLSIDQEFGFPFLVINLESLSVVSTLEQDEVLRLYKYVICKEHFKNNVDLVYYDELDLFHFYRSQGYQFRLPVGSEKAALFLRTNTGLPLKQEAFLHSRIHAVPSRYKNITVEVSSVYSNSQIPIYFCNVSKEILKEHFGFVIEITSSRWIWVVPKENIINEFEMKYYYLVIDMLTYWIWQVSSHLEAINQFPYETINVEVSLNDIEEWDRVSVNYDEGCNPFCSSSCENNIYLSIGKPFAALLFRADNLAEKKSMMHLLHCMADLFEREGILLERQVLLEELERVMLPKEKKKIIVTNPGQSELTPIGLLPPFRPIQPEDENGIIKEISSFVKEKKISPENLTEKEKSSLLNEIVGFLFRKLEKEIALFEPHTLINMLIIYNDSAVKKRMTSDLNVPAFVACYPEGENALKQIEKETKELNQASVAIRFLIEYVAASPPKGNHDFTLEKFDRLLAIASRIISLGQESDLIRYKLGKVDIIIEKDGGFSTRASKFADIYSSFYYSIIKGEVHQRTENFKYNWIDSEDGVKEDESAFVQFKAGFNKEFGLNYFDFVQLAGMFLEISIRREVPDVCEPIDKLKLVAKKNYGIAEEVFDQFVAIMSLSKRSSFLNPSKPFEKYDVWPWRFNRELSYLRRPLILHDDFLIFSYNHLYNSLYYFVSLFFNGTFKAKCLEMKQYISKYVNETGEKFNQKVEEYFRLNGDLIVRSQVKKIGKHKIQSENGELGDIDVLVINPKKRIIWLVECKDLNRARTPYEIHHEHCKLFIDSVGDSCIVTKHKRRADWLERNLQIALSNYNIETNNLRQWRVMPFIVISNSMISPILFDSSIKVICLDKLVEMEF
ncbi:hypothetical protein QJ48_18145 [Paenibacillus sp. A3]|uniref:hypothetical protein n=1 Tax=Paenibacillus sp. A3 TaxID=1337054 RepID=UPI0006D575B4|nr:hypothetical protein [Paenibacillus sp. A3]KPV58162.1 hypothetical protein QJ48_18145 [Paenibacillus sp. A3]